MIDRPTSVFPGTLGRPFRPARGFLIMAVAGRLDPRPEGLSGDLGIMATVTMPLRIGPADHGRMMTLDEFEEADLEEGFRYELARGVLASERDTGRAARCDRVVPPESDSGL